METKLDHERMFEKIDVAKRDFVKKVVIGTAFAVPVINSFSMEGLKIDLSGEMAKPAFAKGESGKSGKSGKSGGVNS